MPNSQDHDLLIRLDTNMMNLTDEVRLLRDGSAKRLTDVENGKLDKTSFDSFISTAFGDHEKRIRKVEKYYFSALAIVGFLNFILLMIAAFKK